MPIIYVQESELRRNLSSLKRELKSLLELALIYKWQLKEINDRLEDIMRRKKRKYTRKLVRSQVQIDQCTNIPQNVKCPKCEDTGLINADRAGIVARFCDCAIGQEKQAKEKRIYER